MPFSLALERAFAIGFHKQSALQTALASASCWRLSPTNFEIGQVEPVDEDNAQDFGKGHPYTSQLFASHINTSAQFNARLSSENAATIIGFGLGDVTKEAAGNGFKYICRPLATSSTDGRLMPATTILAKIPEDGSVEDYGLIGMCLEDFTLRFTSAPGRDNSLIESNWVGCGKFAEPSSIVLPDATVEHLLPSTGASTFTVNGIDYKTNAKLVTFELRWQNGIDQDLGFYPGSGSQTVGSNVYQLRGRMLGAGPQLGMSITAYFDEDSTERSTWASQTQGAISIVIPGALISTGVYHQIEIDVPIVQFANPRTVQQGQWVGIQYDVIPIYDDDNDEILVISVTTEQDKIMEEAA